MNRVVRGLWLPLVVTAVTALSTSVQAATVTVINETGGAVTLSDFYAFTGEKNTGTKTEILKKGDATDDINIAGGDKKNITVPDGTKSVTISWMNSEGKEVETDWNGTSDFKITKKRMCVFNAPAFGGKFAVDLLVPAGNIPADGANVNIVNGKISGGLYDWMTFYDVTGSNGDIVRDGSGNPTSPLLDGVSMTVASHHSVQFFVAAPGSSQLGLVMLTVLLLLAGYAGITRRRHGPTVA